jgi:endo-1,4-beta-D-glucanase Y
MCRFEPILSFIKILCLALLTLPGACQPDPLADLDRVLADTWRSYRQSFISPEGRVVIPEQGGSTISEAQAYALLRAVWAGDEATFGRVHAWTQANLSRAKGPGDYLLSWSWGQRPDGSWGLKDANTATDADVDCAVALILAARRGWRPPPDLPDYLEEARQVMEAVLEKETVALPSGELILTPGNWHEAVPPYLVNPSYFSPAAYRLAAEIQSDPRWVKLHQSAYRLLGELARGLEGQPGVGLFPDWCRVDGAGRVSAAPGRDTRFGWEAVRLPWRLALDRLWFGETRGAQLLSREFLPFFRKEWQAKGELRAIYHYDGTPAADYESPVLYAGVLAAALTAGDRDFAGQMARKIVSFYHEQDGRAYFVSPDNYYANNWAWLGLALYAGWEKPFAQNH